MRKNIFILVCVFALISFAAVMAQDECPLGHGNGIAMNVKAGQQFNITLKSNPTTGYKWQLGEKLDAKYLKLISSKYTQDKNPKVGTGGREVWVFKALSKGQAKICLKYLRPWEKNIKPAEVNVYVVNIK